MSFSLLNASASGARERLSHSEDFSENQNGLLYISESRKIQEKIFAIQSKTSVISQLCYGMTTTSPISQRQELHKLIASLKELAYETEENLRAFAPLEGQEDATQRVLMHRKLTSNFQQALQAVDRVTQRFLQTNVSLSTKTCAETPLTTPTTWRTSVETNSDTDVISSKPSSIRFPPLQPDKSALHEPFLADYRDDMQTSMTLLQQADSQTLESAELEKKLIEERYAGISQIQKDIVGLHEMYQEFSWHVETQGETIENIEVNLNQSVNASENAAREVANARRNRRTRTWLMVTLSLACVATVAVMLAILLKIF